jgi:hypothetical protein
MSRKTSKKVKMTYKKLSDEFYNGIIHLGSLPIKDLDTMIGISKTRTNIQGEFDIYQDLYKQIAEESCLKDDNGKPILENNNFKYKTEEETNIVFNRLKDLGNKEVEVVIHPFSVKMLESVENVTANLLSSLDKMILI